MDKIQSKVEELRRIKNGILRFMEKEIDLELLDFEYENYRYLKDESDNDLRKRYINLHSNLLTLNEDGEVMLKAYEIAERWYDKLVKLLYEYEKRGVESPKSEEIIDCLPRQRWDNGDEDRLKEFWDKHGKKHAVVKFSKPEWLEETLTSGHIYFSPASEFKDPDKPDAAFDDELKTDFYLPSDSVTATHIDQETGEETELPLQGNLERSIEMPHDYWLYCVTKTVDLRLFDDFDREEYDAIGCLVISDIEEFKNRMTESLESIKEKGHIPIYLDVKYYDPFREKKFINQHPRILECQVKHYKFAYQKEYRFVILPSTDRKKIEEPIELELGSLEDIAELIVLD